MLSKWNNFVFLSFVRSFHSILSFFNYMCCECVFKYLAKGHAACARMLAIGLGMNDLTTLEANKEREKKNWSKKNMKIIAFERIESFTFERWKACGLWFFQFLYRISFIFDSQHFILAMRSRYCDRCVHPKESNLTTTTTTKETTLNGSNGNFSLILLYHAYRHSIV